jgi:nitrogen regulatory protein PII 2
MKEIMAVIRQSKVKETMEALAALGVTSVTIHSLNGRGRQGGNIMECIDPLMDVNVEYVSKIYKFPTPSSMAGDSTLTKPVFWVPKSLLDIVVSEVPAEKVAEAIMSVNRTGAKGDGKVFVLPIADAMRIRTGERGDAAIV